MSESLVSSMKEFLVGSNQVCESIGGCDKSPTVLVWCDHHQLGCGYTGWRCDIHLNLLIQEAQIEMVRVARSEATGDSHVCDQCMSEVKSGRLTDHVRWFRL